MKPVAPTRDSVTTIGTDGSRRFLHPADTRGRWIALRRGFAVALVALLASLPAIPIGGHPAVFLDLANRRLHLFGGTFAYQDLWLAFFLLTGVGFTLYVMTAVLGRVWCGWACPHTVFMEHVYRPIERLIDGDAPARRRLDEAPWSAGKVARRVLKLGVFAAVSFLVVHLVLAYFVSLPGLWVLVTHSPGEHWGLFLFAAVATAVLTFHFSWFREQLCLIICPYGRLQSALLDADSMVVGYDARRGEPRGPPTQALAGACVDCRRCVQVCPTGIDIRQGLQLECVACTACIDACDEVMLKLGREPGLVRYDSQNVFNGAPRRFWRPRMAFYAILFAIGACAFGFALAKVAPFHAGVTRFPGAPYYRDGDRIRNQYEVRLINKSDHPVTITIGAESEIAGLEVLGSTATLGPLGEDVFTLVLTAPAASVSGASKVVVTATSDAGRTLRAKAEFLAPGSWARIAKP